MRPVRLSAEGFTTFRDLVDVDFTGADFFALVGLTGSGKSSVLDAICFALYGSVPRYADDRLVAPAITQGAAEARVSLTFEIEGEEYIATRIARRTKTGASTREARLEHGTDVIAGDARQMNAAVAELIGLPFHHFTRCVVLPQGEFAEFLHDKPSDRQDLIVKLLDLQVYERMRQRASARAATGQNAIAIDEHRIESLVGCTPEAEISAREMVAQMKKLRARLAKAQDEVQALQEEAVAASREAEAAKRAAGLLNVVKVPKPVRTLAQQRESALEAQEQATSIRVAAEAALQQQQKAVENLPDPTALQQILDAHQQLDSIRQQLADLDIADAHAEPNLAAARAALDDVAHKVRHAEADFETAVEDSAATELASALVVGEPCPVCEQVVKRKPKARAGQKKVARKARDGARKQEAAARKQLEQATKRSDQLAADRNSLQKQASTLQLKVADASDAEDIAQHLVAVQTARRLHAEMQKTYQDSVNHERAAAATVSGVDSKLAESRRACEAQRDPLVSTGLIVPSIGTDLIADWDALASWAAEEIPVHQERHQAQAQLAEQKADAAASAVRELVETAEAAGLSVPHRPHPTVAALREVAAAAERDAVNEVTRITDGIREAAEIGARITSAREAVVVAQELARLLRSDRFEQWVVNEALESLVAGASATLDQLSSGQYALAVDDHNEFEVIDHRNADERRSAKTLSGGETFQASLALSLALADQVGALAAGGAAKLDAIFLDEGFGTLDPDCLDTVAGTLETLGGDGRMVGIVTHVRDLAGRVPVRFEVAKGPRTSTITRVDT